MSDPSLDVGRIQRAGSANAPWVRQTPILDSNHLEERAGGRIVLKAENRQVTGSFKLRGALAKLAALEGADCRAVITGSAGNHAQALAYAARVRRLRCTVVMPRSAPVAKVESARAFGAEVILDGDSVDEAVAVAERISAEAGCALVHPFDDVDVVVGQGTLGLELVGQVPDLARVIVPVGGGGLAAGVAVAIKSLRPGLSVIGVQAEAYPSTAQALGGRPVRPGRGATLADGIAIKRPGKVTLPLLRRWLDEIVVVSEREIAEAMAVLLQLEKLVVEGAGAVGVAALLAGAVEPAARGVTAVVLSGGNVDASTLTAVLRHQETLAGRRLVLFTRIEDHPGALARFLTRLGQAGGNVLEVTHIRDGIALDVGETGVQVVLETRNEVHAAQVCTAIEVGGYSAERLGPEPLTSRSSRRRSRRSGR